MKTDPRSCDLMLLIVYALPEDADARGYDDWLRRVDNPFFNAASCIAHYGNWKVAGGVNPFAPQTHFDFLCLATEADFDPAWNDADLNAFRREWKRLWGLPEGHPSARIETWYCERTARAEMAWSPRLALLPAATAAPMAGWETWRAVRSLRGTGVGPAAFHVRYLGASEAPPPEATGAAIATCIAAPGL
jgi:hypothetical protein